MEAEEKEILRLIKNKKDRKLLKSYGFNFFKIDDHHSGAHTEKGIFAIINADDFYGSHAIYWKTWIC